MSQGAKVEVVFLPDELRTRVHPGTLLTGAMLQAGLHLPLDCGGNGTCGRCRVQASGALSQPDEAELRLLEAAELADGWRLACRTQVLGPVEVRVPDSAEKADASWPIEAGDTAGPKVERPVIRGVACRPAPPSLEDPRPDLGRIMKAARPEGGPQPVRVDHLCAGDVSRLARENAWDLTAYVRRSELVGAAAAGQGPLGLAVDLGSTKLAAYLLDMESGAVLAARGCVNPQVSFGADVVTRLQRAIQKPADGAAQRDLVRRALNDLAGELAARADVDRRRICEMSLVGNTAMTHLLLDLPLEQLGAQPFVAAVGGPLDIKARDLGIELAPGAYLHLPPLVGGYVGSDNVAMILGCDLDRPGKCRLGLDIGTNTEVVLHTPGPDGGMLIASAPSGPTFEGAHLSSGMRAMAGAVCGVSIGENGAACRTIDGGAPAGLCGSGIIDAVAALLGAGLINGNGHLDRGNPLVDATGRAPRFVLCPAESSASGRDVAVSQADISQVQLAKAAVRAAALTLLSLAGLSETDLDEVLLAGSFGSHFDVANARAIGLLPESAGAVYSQVGNAAGRGAQMTLVDHGARDRAALVPAAARYVELAAEPIFNRLFARCLVFTPPGRA